MNLLVIGIILTGFLLTDEINELLVMDDLDTAVIRKGFLGTLTIVIALFTAWGSVGLMAQFSPPASKSRNTTPVPCPVLQS